MSRNPNPRIKAAAVEHWVPRDRDQVNEAIAELGRLQRERVRIETALNDEQAQVKARYDAEAKPHGERISVRSEPGVGSTFSFTLKKVNLQELNK